MVWRRALLGLAYRRASAPSSGPREISTTPLGFDLSAPFAFSETTPIACLKATCGHGTNLDSAMAPDRLRNRTAIERLRRLA